MLKERMTPDELAELTGYSRQTINKWVRKQGWVTSPRPGIQGGKARLVHVNEQVREFIRNAQRTAQEVTFPAVAASAPSLEILLLTLAREMTAPEQKQLSSLLLRDGITGLLLRLGIREQN